MSILFEIPGTPQGKARARTTKFGSYTPEKTVLYENYIKLCYQQVSKVCTDKPLEIFIESVFEPTKSTSKVQRQAMLSGLIKPTKKPDIDNIAKTVLDALNGIAYKDDTQVIKLTIDKSYGEVSSVKVLIKEVGD
jgi:Holliday junction resolvase RusA-like endonuclease